MIMIIFSMLIFSIFNLIFMCKSILSTLISLEYLIMIVFMMMYYCYASQSPQEILIFLVMVVGESVLGLVLLLMKVSFNGNDFFLSLNVI